MNSIYNTGRIVAVTHTAHSASWSRFSNIAFYKLARCVIGMFYWVFY